jgi:hypothetical protein
VEGGLASYGADLTDVFRRTASYIDRILRGEKAGDLPVQQPTKFDLVTMDSISASLRARAAIGSTLVDRAAASKSRSRTPSGFCALAARGHKTAAPPISVMNPLRLIGVFLPAETRRPEAIT